MELEGRNATWLELAVAPLWRLGQTRVRLHALSGGEEGCLGITVDDRWLCANDGRLTVFGCRDSALRFLELLRIDHMEDGEPSELPADCGCRDVQCMRLGNGGLRVCDGKRSRARRGAGPKRLMSQPPPPPPRASLSTDFMR